MDYERIIREVIAAKKPTFEQWVSKKRFVNVETKRPSSFDDLPETQKTKIEQKYKSEMQELEREMKRKKEEQKRKRRETQAETWTEARIKREAVAWAKDSVHDYPPLSKQTEDDKKSGRLAFEDVVDDLASNFYDQEGVPEFFKKKKRITPVAALSYIADIMMTAVD